MATTIIGTVDNVEVAGNDHTYDVTASRAYQGTPERSTQVFSAGGKNACGLGELAVGTSYLFLATGTEAPFEADSCGGTSVANPTKVAKIEGLLRGTVGGLARVRTLRKSLEAEGRPVLVLHGGDLLFPSVMSKYLRGNPMIRALNLLEGDAAALAPSLFLSFGNHELENRDP